MRYEELVARLGAALGEPALAPDGEGRITLTFQGGLAFTMRPLGRGQVVVEAPLEALPEAGFEREQLLRRTMERALGRLLDHPEIVALDAAADRLVLHRRLDIDQLDYAAVEEALGAFLDRVEAWRGQRVAQPRQAPPPMMIFP
jgi:hypothetical protein